MAGWTNESFGIIGHMSVFGISLLSNAGNCCLGERRASELLQEIFDEIINSPDGDYVIVAKVLAGMKPEGW
jgi:hypothetical protein